MSGRMYHFTVHGRAVPQGSKTAFVNKHTGRAQMRESSPRHKDWRDLVRIMAQDANTRPEAVLEGPVQVGVHFMFKRPKSHYHQRKSGVVLRDDAPLHAISRSVGDIDKLQRTIFDAVTDAGWIRDDSQISVVTAFKGWSDNRDYITVSVRELA